MRHDLERYPVGNKKLESELAKRWPDSREEYITSNLRLAIMLTNQFFYSVGRDYGTREGAMEKNDLVSAAYQGLCDAANRYNPEIGRFTTYARWWIMHHLIETARNMMLPMSLPPGPTQDWYSYTKPAIEQYYGNTGEIPTEAILRTILPEDWTAGRTDRAVKLAGHDMLGPLHINLVDPDHAYGQIDSNGYGDHGHTDLKARIHSAMNNLKNDVDRYVLVKYYSENFTLQEIGTVLGITRERVRQIRNRAMQQMRNPKILHLLESAWEDNTDDRISERM